MPVKGYAGFKARSAPHVPLLPYHVSSIKEENMAGETIRDARWLGWGFLLAWVFCVFYSGSMDDLSTFVNAQAEGFAQKMLVGALPVGSAVVSLGVIAGVEKRYGSPAENRPLTVAAPIAVAVATPVLLSPIHAPLLSQALFALAAVVTGAGSAIMWVLWGQLYARLPQDATESHAPASAVCAAVLTLVTLILPPAASITLAALFPLASGVLFLKAWPDTGARDLSDHGTLPASPLPAKDVFGSMGKAGFGIFAACAFVSIEGQFWNASTATVGQIAGIFAASALFMIAVSASATAGPRRVSLAFAYRWMCPLMVAGFAALILFDAQTGPLIAAAVAIASRFAFCVITQMYFASLASRGAATAVQAYSIGWLFVHVGDLVGVLVAEPLREAVSGGALATSGIAAVLMVLLVAAVMFALNDGGKFLEWDVPGEGKHTGDTGDRQQPRAVASLTAAGRAAAGLAAAGRATAGHAAAGHATAGHATAGQSLAAGLPRNTFDGPTSDLLETDGGAEPAASASGNNAGKGQPEGNLADKQHAEPEKTVGGGNAAEKAAAGQQSALGIDERIAQLAATYKLTPRETEVFGLLAHGRSIPYVRDALFISRDTAATHAKHIYAKLDVHSRQELIDLVMDGEER